MLFGEVQIKLINLPVKILLAVLPPHLKMFTQESFLFQILSKRKYEYVFL